MKLNMNRREFLAAFGTIAASAVLAGCGGTKTATTAGAPIQRRLLPRTLRRRQVRQRHQEAHRGL